MYSRKVCNQIVTIIEVVTVLHLGCSPTTEYSQHTKSQPPTLPRSGLNKFWTHTHTKHTHGHTKPQVGAAPHHKNIFTDNQIYLAFWSLGWSCSILQSVLKMTATAVYGRAESRIFSGICPAPCVLRQCTVVFAWNVCARMCNAAYVIFIMWKSISG